MDIDPDEFKTLQISRLNTVQKLTELNARHISSQTRISGIEIETARYQDAIDSGDTDEQINRDIKRLKQEYEEILESRAVIDLERDALNAEIKEIDDRIQAISQTI